MKVAMVTRDYPPAAGGIATHTHALAEHLTRLGIDVRVMTGRSDLRTLAFPFREDLGGYDLVHVQSSPYGAFVKNSRLVVTVHAPVLAEMRHYAGWTTKVQARLAVPMEKRTFARAGRIIAVSQSTKNDLVSLYGLSADRIWVVTNGVDTETFAGAGRRPSSGPLRVLVVSRLEPRKNVGEVIRASGTAPGQLTLEIVGDGSQRERLSALSREEGREVRFTGRLAQEQLPDAYRRSDVLVAPGMAEGSGLTILEGWASGCAVVASDTPAHRELIADGTDGFLYRTTPELTKTLSMLAEDRGRAAKVAEAGRQKAGLYSWDEVAREVASIYAGLIEDPRS